MSTSSFDYIGIDIQEQYSLAINTLLNKSSFRFYHTSFR